MTVAQAIQHIKKRFEFNDELVIISRDKIAINTLIETINSQLVANRESLALKLYIYAFVEQVIHYKESPASRIPQIQLHKWLDKPLSYHLDSAVDKINNSASERFLSQIQDDVNFYQHPDYAIDQLREASNKMTREYFEKEIRKQFHFAHLKY